MIRAGRRLSGALERVRGMRDESPGDVVRREALTRRALGEMRLFGYRQVATPVLEKRSLFVHSLGADSDAVAKELYQVDAETAMRPENTAGVVRMFAEGGYESQLPVRWSYDGDMFRRERPQRGRWRQFRQIGAEVFSGAGLAQRALCDVELIVMGWRVVSGVLGAERAAAQVALQINTLGDGASRKAYANVLRDFLESKRSVLSAEGVARLDRGSLLRVLDSKQDAGVVQDAPPIAKHLTEESRRYWELVLQGLSGAGVAFNVVPSLVRGLDYYQDTVWEFVHRGETLGAQQATVLAGGRYDSLVGQVMKSVGNTSSAPVAAAGWAMGVDRLLLLTEDGQEAEPGPVVVLAVLPDSEAHRAVQLSCRLADAGVASELITGASLRKLLNDANRRRARFAVILGSDELAASRVTVKNMQSGAQQSIEWNDAARVLLHS